MPPFFYFAGVNTWMAHEPALHKVGFWMIRLLIPSLSQIRIKTTFKSTTHYPIWGESTVIVAI